ncbi:MAG: hypothetical protein LQ350_007829 [Teloschistes chrysophthalmus]|nr:MAG: hypothetical protein LQ350_007829 [Niorma chrysophthalma]
MRPFLSVLVFLLSTTTALVTPSAGPESSPTSTAGPVIPVQPIVTYIPPVASSKAPLTKIFAYAGGGFENLVFRSNGQILATTAFPEPLLFYVDPLRVRPGVVLHNFTSLRNTVGITELGPDRFYVHGRRREGGPFTVFSVDMRYFSILPNGTIATPPKVKEIGSIPSSLGLNGMTHLRKSDRFVLIADTLLGAVWKFDIDTGKYNLMIKDSSMAGPPDKTEFAAYGINGLRAQNRTLFYCNSGVQTFYKMKIHEDGSSAGNASLITSGIACDDFALDPWGFAYVASPRNALIRLDTRTGAQLVVAGDFNQDTSEIRSASSARFGVSDSDQTSIYITTNGGAFVGAPKGSQGISRVDIGNLAQAFRERDESRADGREICL